MPSTHLTVQEFNMLKSNSLKLSANPATVSTYDAEGNRLDTVYIGRMPEKGKTQAKRLLEKEVEAITKKHEFKYIVCIADGARDLWLFFRKKYPNAIHVVDFFHVCEHLSKLSELFFQRFIRCKGLV